MFRKSRIAVYFALLASLVLAACAPAAAATTEAKATTLPEGSIAINGGGSSFIQPIYSEWIFAYQYVDPSVALNYAGTGSGAGKKGIVDGTLDFAASDSVLVAAEYSAGKDLQMYPAVAGAVVPIYNISYDKYDAAKDPALPALILDRQTLADIYSAKIKTWNDPAILALNPGLKEHLPAKAITAVHRSDGSGTTEIFTNALAAFSTDWAGKAGSAVAWPVDKAGNGIGGKGNQGVAGAVQNTPNSIGYVELNYAVANKMTFAQLVNKAGKTVSADAKSLSSAINDFASAFDDKLTAKIVDGPGDGSWPIAGYSYIILHTTSMTDCVKAQKYLQFFVWTLNDPVAAKKAGELGYSVLPDAVKKTVIAKLGEVTCSGKPVLTK